MENAKNNCWRTLNTMGLKYESVFHPSALVLLTTYIVKLLSIVKLLWQISLLWKHSHYRDSLNYISSLCVKELICSFPEYGKYVLTLQAAVHEEPDLLFSVDIPQTCLCCLHHPILLYSPETWTWISILNEV